VEFREDKNFAESATAALAGQAEVEALAGNRNEARAFADLALATGQSGTTALGAAYALAMAGEVEFADRVLKERGALPPGDGLYRAVRADEARAAIALARGNARHALELLSASAVAGAGTRPLAPYLRGLAQLKLHNAAAAASEFQSILDHRGLALLDPIFPLAQLGLARAKSLAGERAAARSAYDDFFRLWSKADADVPILLQARAEAAKL
jgi:hypothetical protein